MVKSVHMGMMNICLVFVFCFQVFVPIAVSSVRELCRSEISGLYISASSDKKMYEDLIQRLKNALNPLRAEQTKLERQLSKVIDNQDPELQRSADVLQKRVAALRQQIADTHILLDKANQNAQIASQRTQELESKLKHVFLIKKVQEPEAGLMTWRLDFMANCPKQKETCPLPLDMRNLLKDLLGDETPENCRKYSNIR